MSTPLSSPEVIKLAANITLAVQVWIVPTLQLVCLSFFFVGMVLLSTTVRDAIIGLYAKLVIRRARVDAAAEARSLAAAICGLLYLTPAGRLSACKTLALALASFALVAILIVPARVWYGSSVCHSPCTASLQFMSFTWSGERPNLLKVEDLPIEALSIDLHSAEPSRALPLTLAFHWLAEALAGSLLLRLIKLPSRRFLIAAPFALLVFLAALVATPTLLADAAFWAMSLLHVQPTWDLILGTRATLVNGPSLAFGGFMGLDTMGSGLAKPNPHAFALSLLSSLTFATGLLTVSFANMVARSRAVLWVLDHLTRNGSVRPVAMIALSITSFGFLADGNSSVAAITAVIVKVISWF